MYDGQEELDNLVWDKNDEDSEKSLKELRLKTMCRQVERLAMQKFGRPATLVPPLIMGGFHILYRIQLEEVSPDIMVRLPCPNLVQFPDEKIVQETATAACVAKNTRIPVARQFFYGRDDSVGPFIILEHIRNCGSMSARLTVPNDDPSETHVLNPSIEEATLKDLWSKVARCYLQLSRLSFSRIGSLIEVDSGSYDVAGRPFTHNMGDMVRLANIPRAVLPPEGKTYASADEWYVALAEMHVAQLVFQHNDAVTSEDDCRNKYVARLIFRRLAKQGRLSTFGFAEDDWSAQSFKSESSTLAPAPCGSGSFRLWCDDLRAGNILLNDSDDVAAVIDWEFAYVAPTQFALDPPWWLLLNTAETWASGMEDWRQTYDMRLGTWLSAVKRAEESMEGPGPFAVALSTYMRESWETGRFWLSYAARKSWAFDAVYWRYLDERFFGDRKSDVSHDHLWKSRIHLLTEVERDGMGPFVERKMSESKERIIVDWDVEEAQQRLSEVLCT
ncbi:phosphotransferase [Xylariaceae sp. AK1471]|nr:phosphotransferase [Xylariaceae sp. AK1471]